MPTATIDLTLVSDGRYLAFSKDLLVVAHIFRRVGGEAGPWQRVAINTRSPYLDADVFAPGTVLEYYVQFEPQQGPPEAHSSVASITA